MSTDYPSPTITVIKNDHTGREVWRYSAHVKARTPTSLMLEARFDIEARDLGFVTFRRGDRFVEYHYTDRWYCIYEVHDAEDDHLKGWYCNLQRPAQLDDQTIRADDLALDLWIFPDRRALVLDRDEFEALNLSDPERSAVLAALAALQAAAQQGQPPFGPPPEPPA